MEYTYIIGMIIGSLPTMIILFILYKALTENKDRKKQEEKEFLHLPDIDKEQMILDKAEEHLKRYLACLKIGNINKMKYLCQKDYFDVLKSEENKRKAVDGRFEINEEIKIISKGIIEFRENDNEEYTTVAILIKGYNYMQDKTGDVYGLANYEKYSKYTITYSNLADKNKEEQEGYCLSCGAPLAIENGRCAYCGKYIGETYSDILIVNINKKF